MSHNLSTTLHFEARMVYVGLH